MKQINKFKINYKGFTLIEILVVISIIAVLIAISLFGTQGLFENSRDTKRKSDLRQYQAALESFANKNNGLFPVQGAGGTITNICTALGLGAAATNCPEDPKNDVANYYYYNYNSNDLVGGSAVGSANASLFTLSTRLEGDTTKTFVLCSNGKSGITASTTYNTEACPAAF